MDLFPDEKWKLPKKASSSSVRREQPLNSSGPHFRRTPSIPEFVNSGRRPPPSAAASSSFTRRCAKLVKEQRAKFYIMRRCVTMLICWRDY